MHDPRVGRFFAIDPLDDKYPHNSPYAFSENRVIDMVELEGLESTDTNDKKESKDKSSFVDGWNQKVGEFNNNFFNGVNKFLEHPVDSASKGTLNFLNGSVTLISDCTGITQLLGIENKTGETLLAGINKLSNVPNMSNKQLGSLAAGTTIFAGTIIVTEKLPVVEAVEFQVGEYASLAKAAKGTGLDAHHVGQSAVMKKLVKNYDHATAPAILVSKYGHRFKKPQLGIVSRSSKEIQTVRQLIARDAFELRRVYKVPNEKLQQLIKLNKEKYPEHFKKPSR